MVKGKGKHLEHKKVKSSIIEFILKNEKEVPEPAIRDYLKKEHDVIDQSTINKHLHDLRKLDCIELIPPVKSGLRNYWDIKNIKNLKNIRFHFDEIKLNNYVKSIYILLDERLLKKISFSLYSSRAKKTFIQLYLSASCFNLCLNADIETLYTNSLKLYKLGACFTEKQLIDELIVKEQRIKELNSEVLTEFIKKISITSDIISEEKFQEMLEEIPLRLEDKSREERIRRIIKEMSVKMSRKILPKRLKEKPEKSLNVTDEMINKMSEQIFIKIMEENPKELYDKIRKIKYNQSDRITIGLDIIFEHCFQRDVIEGIEIEKENEFISELKEIPLINKEDIISGLADLDNLYAKYFDIIMADFGIHNNCRNPLQARMC